MRNDKPDENIREISRISLFFACATYPMRIFLRISSGQNATRKSHPYMQKIGWFTCQLYPGSFQNELRCVDSARFISPRWGRIHSNKATHDYSKSNGGSTYWSKFIHLWPSISLNIRRAFSFYCTRFDNCASKTISYATIVFWHFAVPFDSIVRENIPGSKHSHLTRVLPQLI